MHQVNVSDVYQRFDDSRAEFIVGSSKGEDYCVIFCLLIFPGIRETVRCKLKLIFWAYSYAEAKNCFWEKCFPFLVAVLGKITQRHIEIKSYVTLNNLFISVLRTLFQINANKEPEADINLIEENI